MMFLCVTILIFSGFMETMSENFKVVGPAAPLVVIPGEDLVLPCSINPSISAVHMTVEWVRTDTDNIVHLYEDHEDRSYDQAESYRGRTALFKEELQKGNTSLKLSAVQPSDHGPYKCLIQDKSWNDATSIYVEVSVHSKVVGPAAPLLVEAGEDLVLPCSLQPNISAVDMVVEWSRLHLNDRIVHLYEYYKDRSSDQMESYKGRTSLFKEELKKGNTSLKLSALQLSDEGAYKCYIEYLSWNDDVIVYVEVKGKHFHGWKIAIICISLFAVILIIFTTYVLKDKFSKKELSPAQCSVITYMRLQSENARKEFDLKNYNASEEGYRRLIPSISNYRKARFVDCNLTAQSLKILSAALQTDNFLKELDLSKNNLQASGKETLSAGLKSSHCKLEILRLAICNFNVESCKSLVSALQTKISLMKELDLCSNELQDSAQELLSEVKGSHCKLEILRLALCNLGVKTCENLGSLLKLENSPLKELDLSNNDLQDSGVELLSAGLKSSQCKLEILGLSGCMITEKGCSSLATALSSNPSHLKELALTYNHPGESGVKLLSARQEDPQCALNTLRYE